MPGTNLRRLLLAAAIASLFCVPSVVVSADTATLYATKDAYIWEIYPDTPEPDSDLLAYALDACESPHHDPRCDRDNDGYVRAATLLQFDLSAIPPGSVISSCELHLQCFEFSQSSARPPGLGALLYGFRVTSLWPEEVTWYTKPTWTKTLAPQVFLEGIGHVLMDDPALADIVQLWTDGAAENYGLLLWPEDDDWWYSLSFYSRETASIAQNKPRLEVQYSLPPTFPLPEVLLEAHPNERGQGPPSISLNTGAPFWTWPTPTGAGAYTWKNYRFGGSSSLWIQVCAQNYAAFQNMPNTGFGNQDTLLLMVDAQTPSDIWGLQSGPPGGYQWKGDVDWGKRLSLEFCVTGLTPGLHTLRLTASMCPIIYWVKVYDLQPRYAE